MLYGSVVALILGLTLVVALTQTLAMNRQPASANKSL